MIRFVLIGCIMILASCTSDQDTSVTTITMWHFWSEPSQRSALRSLLDDYESAHPDVRVELTELSWSDGKAKLQLAFNAGTEPDIVHIGMDWEEEFRSTGVFAAESPLPTESEDRYRKLWVVNARALAVWTGAHPRFKVGLCRSDAHNVLKRCLPYLWQFGAEKFYRGLPTSETMDSALVDALWKLHLMAVDSAVIETSRSLDERFLRGEIGELYSGAWIIDMARTQNVTTFKIVPTPSIKNGDVLVVTQRSTFKEGAANVIAWLADPNRALRFCKEVSDAGFPAELDEQDTLLLKDPLTRGFAETVRLSSPLPNSPIMLRLEPIIEDLIERSYAAGDRKQVAEMVLKARAEVKAVERDHATR